MVDAISAVNAAVNTEIQRRKDVSINWRNLTASEVLEHAGRGEDVPAEILKWAKDYSKQINAPENVSYDAVNGATQAEYARENAGTKEPEAAKEAAEETEGNDDSPREVQQEVSLYEKAGVHITNSEAARENSDSMVADTEEQSSKSETTAAIAAQRANDVEQRTKSTKAQYDELLNRIASDKSNISPADLVKLSKLSAELMSVGNRAQNELAIYDAQLKEIEEIFSEYAPIPPNVSDRGADTKEAGMKLVGIKQVDNGDVNSTAIDKSISVETKEALQKARAYNFDFIFTRDYVRGLMALEESSRAEDTSNEGSAAIISGEEKNSKSLRVVDNAISKAEDITMATDKREDKHINEKKETEEQAKKKRENNNNKHEVNGVKDETKLTTEPLEIQKRRERRGDKS